MPGMWSLLNSLRKAQMTGPFDSLKPTRRRLLLQFCEVWHFDKDGQMVSGNVYYDQYTLLTQLGQVQPLAAAA